MYALDFLSAIVVVCAPPRAAETDASRHPPTRRLAWHGGERMRIPRWVPVLAVRHCSCAACSGSTATNAPSAAQPSAAAPATPAASTPAESAAPSESAAAGCAERRARRGLRAVGRPERDADVGAVGRQQRHGRPARLRLEHGQPGQADQSQLHPPRRDGRQDRPGHRVRRRARPDGHGPDLRPAVRERRPARRPDRQDQGLARAHDGEPRPHDRRDVQRPPLRRAAVRRRVGPVLQQGPVQEGRSRSRTSRRRAWPSCASTPTRSRRSATASRATTCPATARAATSSRSAR